MVYGFTHRHLFLLFIFHYIQCFSSYKHLISRKFFYFLINWIDVGIKLGPSFSAAGHTITNQIHSKRKWVYCVLRMSSSLYIQLLQPLIENSVFVVVVSSPIEGKLFPSYLFSAITSQHSSRCVSRDNCYLLVCLFETCFRYEYRWAYCSLDV